MSETINIFPGRDLPIFAGGRAAGPRSALKLPGLDIRSIVSHPLIYFSQSNPDSHEAGDISLKNGNIHLRGNRPKRAIEDYQRVRDKGLHIESEAKYNLGVAHYRLEEYAQAAEQFQVSMFSVKPEGLLSVAKTRYNLSRHRFSLKEFSKVAGMDLSEEFTDWFMSGVGKEISMYEDRKRDLQGFYDAKAGFDFTKISNGEIIEYPSSEIWGVVKGRNAFYTEEEGLGPKMREHLIWRVLGEMYHFTNAGGLFLTAYKKALSMLEKTSTDYNASIGEILNHYNRLMSAYKEKEDSESYIINFRNKLEALEDILGSDKIDPYNEILVREGLELLKVACRLHKEGFVFWPIEETIELAESLMKKEECRANSNLREEYSKVIRELMGQQDIKA
jgi:tetratricopeptide (TPR) repeat protein